jgi:CDP-L-myo-inositol myo-inositolphosphotransferase
LTRTSLGLIYGSVTTRAPIPATAVVMFGSAHDADRRLAGVTAAGRIVRELSEAGFSTAWLAVPRGQAIGDAAREDIVRLAGPMTVRFGEPGAAADVARLPGDRLIPAAMMAAYLHGERGALEGAIALDQARAEREILRTTGKASDGLVSRWLNRPISRQVSGLLLHLPGVRPIHASFGTALLAVAMFAALVTGSRSGLIAGALLFQAASIVDGVDGEIARATFRTTRKGAALDSAIDMTTNVAAMLGMAINLARRGDPDALPLVAWALAFFLPGLALIGRRSLRRTGTISFDAVKHEVRGRAGGLLARRLMALATLGTSRDFCALVYLALVVAGIPIVGLYLFAVVTPVWMVFVAKALLAPAPSVHLTHEGGR